MTIFDADRFTSTVAPASAANDDGGTGTQTSSQISTWKRKNGMFSISNSSPAPKGTVAPSSEMRPSVGAQSAALNWRAS
ncbi:hypothetical protein D3C71_1816800 [compost metagenome]